MNNITKTHDKVGKALNEMIDIHDKYANDPMRYFLEIQSILTKLYNAGYSEGFADCIKDIPNA